MVKNDKPIDQMTYEEAFAALEDIIKHIEAEELNLEESVKLYEKGQKLAAHCTMLLENAQLKIQTLSGEDFTGI